MFLKTTCFGIFLIKLTCSFFKKETLSQVFYDRTPQVAAFVFRRISISKGSSPEVFCKRGDLKFFAKFTISVALSPTFRSQLSNSTQPIFQRPIKVLSTFWINVLSTLWINVDIKLVQRWKWNKIRRRFFSVAQSWYNVGSWCWNNVETTLHSVASTLFQRSLNVVEAISKQIGLLIMDL